MMNILMTNDDGIDSDGIQKLAWLLRSSGKYNVTVIAPDTNRSGISHALSLLNGPVKLCELGKGTWSCTGYPSDCIIAGLKGVLSEWPDLVLSGINRGANLGTDVIYSGTAAAARQASLVGIPAIALSLSGCEPFYWDMASAWVVDHLDELLTYWREDTFVNVNIPNNESYPEGLAATWPAVKNYQDTLSIMIAPDGSRYCFLESGEETTVQETGSDNDTVSRNFVSVSPIYNFPVVQRELCPGAPNHAAVTTRVGIRYG
ncbi:MAG: 5'/3'-nucleotidase SurE [Treponema sp.]|jgi:5'-nucleotidase|nr:5'/3'-nucleotidase SurE [Treponema sp.]